MVRRLPRRAGRSLSTVLVTGAGGYLGSRLAAVLGSTGSVAVRALGRSLPAGLEGLGHIQAVELDLLGPRSELDRAMAGVESVVHLAGHNEVVAAAEPERALVETVAASARVAAAATRAGVARLVYVSTVHAYGARMAPGAVLDEELAPAPRSAYAIARVASEHLVQVAGEGGVETVLFRLTNAVGAPVLPDVDRWSLVAADLCRQAVVSGRLVLRSPGHQWRDFVALSDVCSVLAGSLAPGSLAPGLYNLGSGRCLTVRQLAALVQDAVEARTGRRPPLSAPSASGPTDPYLVSVEALAAQGRRCPTPVAQAVDETLAFCLEHAARLWGAQVPR